MDFFCKRYVNKIAIFINMLFLKFKKNGFFDQTAKFGRFFLMLLVGIFLPLVKAMAICPVCTVVIGVGVGLSRWLGIDDTITGVWVGGLTVSMIGWTIDWLNKINFRFYGRKILTTLFYYAIVILPLYAWGIMGLPEDKLWGIDKLLLGIVVGSVVFVAAVIYYNYLKKQNLGKAHFRGQKIVIPIGALAIFSLIFYLLT